ncbi:MAG: Do family serine endopeptidase [Rhodospirillales bacterium]|nr:Do family serine endopeptidase [Rhodospirillales bacterium]MCB9996855.1 Do family serine endopeptidase [Rhodospirillales bacterium]
MKSFFLSCLVFWSLTPAAFAQERAVPSAQAQIQLSFAPLVKQVSPAVINIYTKRVVTQQVSPFFNDPFFGQFFGPSFGFGSVPRQRVENSLGSGVIVEASGLAVTNAHVIKDADEITVGLPDGREFAAEKVVVDEASDLAVLQIDLKKETLPYVRLKPSETLEVGDLVLAIGNPFGVGQTVTSGIVSAQARSSLDINDFNFFIQTDAAINPGNSGGPLVAMDGSVVGINTAIYSRDGGSLGIGFAIPSEMVATVIAAAKTGQGNEKGIIRPWLGISVQAITSDIADSLEFTRPHGVLVSDLHRASPALKAGLKVGDVVLAINEREIREPAEMKFRMATIPLGEKARFKILQNGREKTIHVTAMAPPDDPPRDETTLDGAHPLNGVSVANINPAVAVESGIREENGVVVLAVPRRSAAIRVTAPGDIIVSINGDTINTVKDLEKTLRRRSESWSFVLFRDGQQRQVILR